MLKHKMTRRELLAMAGAFGALTLVPAREALAAGQHAATTTLTAQEKSDLIFMREEEKLARDVYLTLYDVWGTPVLANIALSEQQHMDAILNLLNLYKLPDPSVGKLVGEFVNAELQALYNELVERGRQSVVEALKVGGVIEETDIEDLVTAMDTARPANIDNVYQNLLNGSYNHLRSFASNLHALTGEPYTAQVVSQSVVDSILNG